MKLKIILLFLFFTFFYILISFSNAYSTNLKEIEGFIFARLDPKVEYALTYENKMIKIEYDKNLKEYLSKKVLIKGYENNGVFKVLSLIETENFKEERKPSFVLDLFHSPKGPQSTYVVLVEFSDVKFSSKISKIKEALNKMNDYYLEVSYGSTYFDYKIHPSIISLEKTLSYYGEPCGEYVDCRWVNFLNDVLIKIDPQVNFEVYYRIIIVHAGFDEAETGNKNDIWSFAIQGEVEGNTDDGKVRISLSVVSEFNKFPVYIHESAHMLGLPDLYSIKNNQIISYMGKWDLLDLGVYNGFPLVKPAHINSLLKHSLGWFKNDKVKEIYYGNLEKVNLVPHEIIKEGYYYIKILIDVYHYYIIEARKKIGFDSALPDEGILIIYVDETKSSGEGPMRLIDAFPSTKNLDDAVFKLNDVYTNKVKKFAISVISLNNDVYLIGANNKVEIKINEIKKVENKERINVGEETIIEVSITWKNNTYAKNLTVILNKEFSNLTDKNGISKIKVVKNSVGIFPIFVSNVKYKDIPLLINENKTISVIWDAIEIYDFSPKFLRVNLNQSVKIQFKLRYAFDKKEFTLGTVKINGINAKYKNSWEIFYSSDKVDKKIFRITYLKDELYGLSKIFEEKEVTIIWDRIKILEKTELKERVKVNSKITVGFKLVSEYDLRIIENADVYFKILIDSKKEGLKIEEIRAKFDEKKKIWYVEILSKNPSKFVLSLKRVVWKDYNIYKINPLSKEVKISVIFDRILVLDYEPKNARIETGNKIKIYAKIVYEYDNLTLEKDSIVYINGIKAKFDEIKKMFYIEVYQKEIKKEKFSVSFVKSLKYNLDNFIQLVNNTTIIFDKISHEIILEYFFVKHTIKIKLIYEFDKSIVKGAKVFVNKKEAEFKNGIYLIEFSDTGIFSNYEIKISKENFEEINENVSIFNYFNLTLYLAIIILISLIFIYLLKLRKLKSF